MARHIYTKGEKVLRNTAFELIASTGEQLLMPKNHKKSIADEVMIMLKDTGADYIKVNDWRSGCELWAYYYAKEDGMLYASMEKPVINK